jgi:transcriptional regulator with XRE-family HTH domain
MNEQIQQIAARIKELREIAGVSAESFANELSISKETLLEYEKGEFDIPVGFLHKVAQRFGLDFSALLRGEEPKLHIYAVTRKGKGLNVDRRKQYKYESLVSNFVHKKADPFIVTVEPDTPLESNTHHGQEFNYVLEGSLLIVVDGHEVALNQGDSIYFDSGYEHAMKALNDLPAKFLAIIV